MILRPGARIRIGLALLGALAIINYHHDIGDYMEWSGKGWYPVNLSNDAYKFATNCLIYGLSR